MRDEDIAVGTLVEVGIVGLSVFRGERGRIREIDTSISPPRYKIDFFREGFSTEWSFEAVELRFSPTANEN